MRYEVHDSSNGITAFISGMVGGLLKLTLTPAYIEGMAKLAEAAFTAFLCGIAGVAGKELYSFIKNRKKKK